MNILFVCSKNKWRSRTAETIFKDIQKINVKSAGTDQGARIRLNEKHLEWADLIFVMEYKHKQIIKQQFRDFVNHKNIIVLEIPDEYQYMDPELIELLQDSLSPYLEN